MGDGLSKKRAQVFSCSSSPFFFLSVSLAHSNRGKEKRQREGGGGEGGREVGVGEP